MDWDDQDVSESPSVADTIEATESLRDLMLAAVVAYTDPITAADRQNYVMLRRRVVRGAEAQQIGHPFRWEDLKAVCAWAKRAGGYAARRDEVEKTVEPFLEQLESLRDGLGVDVWGESSEWTSLEERVSEMKSRLDAATSLDDFQDVGRRSREVILAIASLVFRVEMVPDGEPMPQGANAKEKIRLILKWYLPGASHEELRSLLGKALSFAHKVTHAPADRVDAVAAAQAAVLLTRTLTTMHKVGRTTPTGS